MDAQLILDRLRRDLRRLDRATFEQLHQRLGRNVRFLQRVETDNFKLQEFFALGRMLGYRPSEFLYRFGRLGSWNPQGAVAFFRARGSASAHKPRPLLDQFLEWGYAVLVDEDGQKPTIEFAEYFRLSGKGLPSTDSLEFVDLVCSYYADEHGSEVLRPESALDLIGSLILMIGILCERDRPIEAHALLALALQLEQQIQTVELRCRLFELGAKLCFDFGEPLDGIWCLREAGFAALLIPDFDRARSLHAEATSRSEEKGIGSSRALWNRSPSDTIADGDADLNKLLQLMASDRRAASIPAAELDRHLGAQKAFSMALKGRAPMSLGRWGRFLEALDTSLGLQARRLEMVDLSFPSPEPWIQQLKNRQSEPPKALWQSEIPKWALEVEISDLAPDLDIFNRSCWTTKTEAAYLEICEGFDELRIGLPDRLSPRNGARLHGGLVLTAHILREKDLLQVSSDFLAVSFRLVRQLGPSLEASQLAWAYRTTSVLALHSGSVDLAAMALKRAKMADSVSWNLQGLTLSSYLEAVLSKTIGRYKRSVELHQQCLRTAKQLGLLPVETVLISLARTHLASGNVEGAFDAFRAAEPLIGPAHSYLADFLWIKAETLSVAGDSAAPIPLLEQSAEIFRQGGRVTDLILVEIEKCRHWLRFDQLGKAQKHVNVLLQEASGLKRNPIGRAAIFQLCRDIMSGALVLDSVQETMHRIQHPNLRKLQIP